MLQVTAVVVTPSGDIYSASLDKTIRRWRNGECVQVLEVRCHAGIHGSWVLPVIPMLPLSGLANKLARSALRQIARNHGMQRAHSAMQGHDAAVLCLLLLPNGDLASGSGDCTVKIWSGDKCIHTILAHSDSVR